MNKLLASTLVSIGFATAAITPVMAQTGTPPAKAGPQANHGARHHHEQRDQRAFSKATDRVEARLAYIRTALKVTDAQQPQWNAFADTLRKQAAARDKQMQAWRDKAPQHGTGMTAVQRLEFQQQRHARAAEMLGERLAAQKPLYAALSPEQQKIADEVLAPRRGSDRQHQRGGMHRMG